MTFQGQALRRCEPDSNDHPTSSRCVHTCSARVRRFGGTSDGSNIFHREVPTRISETLDRVVPGVTPVGRDGGVGKSRAGVLRVLCKLAPVVVERRLGGHQAHTLTTGHPASLCRHQPSRHLIPRSSPEPRTRQARNAESGHGGRSRRSEVGLPGRARSRCPCRSRGVAQPRERRREAGRSRVEPPEDLNEVLQSEGTSERDQVGDARPKLATLDSGDRGSVDAGFALHAPQGLPLRFSGRS